MDESEAKKARLSELEQIVKQLEKENKQLLTKVSGGARAEADSGDEGIIDLSQLDQATDEDWLYTSPKLSLTPAQRKHTPLQWLSEGHDRRLGDTAIPTLDEVRKSLVFNMEEAETLSRAAHPPPVANNKTAQGYLNRVRERSKSPVNSIQHNGDIGLEEVPKYLNTNEEVPVVKWKAKVPIDEPPSEEVPVVKWKAKVPIDEPPSEEVPVVKWKARVPIDEPPSEEVPVVKWKAKVPIDEPPSEEVPVVKWKAKVPIDEPPSEEVPVVKWKAKLPSEAGASNKKSPGQSRLAPRGLARPSGVRRTNSELPPKSKREEDLNSSGEFEHRSLRSSALKQSNASPKSPSAIQKATGLRKPRTSSPGQSPLSRSRSPSPAPVPQKKLLKGSVPRQNSTPVKRAGMTPPTGSGKPPQRLGGGPKKQQSVQIAKPTSASKQVSSAPRSGERLSRIEAHKQETPPAGKRVSTPPMRRGLTPPGHNKTRRVLPSTPSPQRTPPPPDDDWLEGCF